ncbi:MAG: 23S rRNA (adenine(2503)-C(2))-methyltransferase RlmN [Anaerolineae bacterium]|nr:23S rRNA (adenine(2503)-C(2))-methyltransferase RlmN [Anaerolineae bacterium]
MILPDQGTRPSDSQTGHPASFYDLSQEELQPVLRDLRAPQYRVRQVWSWAYRHLVSDFEAMTNLPAALRRELARRYTLRPAELVDSTADQASRTRKDLLRLLDGETIETVLMEEPHGHTVCVSTQVGCPMRCTICATGRAGFRRNLTAGEIVYQVVHFGRLLAPRALRVTNVVFMGMGEPLLNYDATLLAIARLADPSGLSISPQRITVSTVGFPDRIVSLASQPYPVRLAISLHGADEETRRGLMPLAGDVPLPQLISACQTYARVRRQRITFEYVMVAGVNDSVEHARRLVSLIGALPAHVNLIPLNPVPGCDLRPSSPDAIEHFRNVLRRSRIPCTVRYSRGVRIRAGCGQLRSQASGRAKRKENLPRRPGTRPKRE